MSVQNMSSSGSGMLGQVDIPDSPVGFLCRDVPLWVSNPPIESVVFAWGASEDHQLGLDTEQDIFQPKVVESLLGIRFMGRSFGSCPLVGGSRNTLALDADGGLWSWGWNDRGTLGHGHRALQRKPAPVEGLSGIEIMQAAIGGWHCLALDSDGQVYCWGGNEYQQCGLVAPEDDEPADCQPGSTNGTLSQQESRVQRWRSGSSADGDGVTQGVLPAVRDILVPRRCMPGLRVKQVACGGMNSVVLTDTGEVWTWGEPWGDFLAMDIQRAPRKVEGAANIAAIACGGFHNLALVADGSVLSWGTNDYGQLGNGSTIYSTTPVEVCDLEDVAVADIAAGGWHSLALTADGQIYVWGRGEYGRLGIGDRTGSSKLRPHKIRGLEEHVVVQVAAGGTHSCCVTSSGRMWIWGRASYGRLGLGADARDMYAPVEVQLPGGHQRWKIAAASAGGRHTMCLAVPVRDGIKGTSMYGGNSDGPSRAASVINEPVNPPPSSSNSRANGNTAAAANASSTAGTGQQQQQDTQQQQQQERKVYDPFATQQQQQMQQSSGSGGGGRSTAPSAAGPDSRAARAGSNAADEAAAAAGEGGGSGSSRGAGAVGVSSPYKPGGALPHGPTLSMQSSYSLVNSPGSSIMGGGSPLGVHPNTGPGGLAGVGPWGAPLLKAEAAAVTGSSAAAAEGASSARAQIRSGTAAGGSSSLGGGAPAPISPAPSPRAAAAGADAGAVAVAAVAAGGGSSGGSEPLPLGVEAVHAATEAAVQQVSAMRLHGLLPTGSGNGGLHAMLASHGPLAAAAAAAAAGGGGLKPGQGSSVSPRGMPPPMSPSQRAVGLDIGSSLREFVSTGDQYDVSGRGDSLQWQHQDVSLELQGRELLIEDDAIQQEFQEEQQREADEAALEAAEERQEEEVRLRRQEHQQQLREAHLRQRQQQMGTGSGPGGSCTGLGVIGPSSGSSNSGRPGSSQGLPTNMQQQQQMRRSHSHQQLTDPLTAVAAAAAAAEMASSREAPSSYGSYSLQRYGSSPQSGVTAAAGGSGSQALNGERISLELAAAAAAASAAGVGNRGPSGPVNISFSAGVGGVRRVTAPGIGSGRPGVGRVDSDASQEGLMGLVEGASPTDSPRNDAAQQERAGSAAAGGPGGSRRAGSGSLTASRGSQGSISGDSTGQGELGGSPPSARYDVGLGERYVANSLPGREQLHHLAHT